MPERKIVLHDANTGPGDASQIHLYNLMVQSVFRHVRRAFVSANNLRDPMRDVVEPETIWRQSRWARIDA